MTFKSSKFIIILKYVFILSTIIFCILAMRFSSTLNDSDETNDADFVLTLILAIASAIITKVIMKKQKQYCPNCMSSLSDCDYEYNILKQFVKSEDILGIKVEIFYKCNSCKKISRIVHTFNCSINNTDHLEYLIDEYCEKTFKH